MKRIRVALAVVGMVAAPLAMQATPAQAAPGVCAGAGLLITPNLYYPTAIPVVGGPFASGSISGNLGVCVHNGGVAASATIGGNVAGHCGQSSGTVTITPAGGDTHSGSFITAGSVVVITGGGVYGVADAVPAPGESCLGPGAPGSSGGANTFAVAGTVTLV